MCTRVCKWNAFLRFFHGKHADGVESRKRAITMFAAENSQWKRTCSAVVEIVRSRARFTQLTNHYGGGLGISVCYVARWKTNVFRERWLVGGTANSGKEECLFISNRMLIQLSKSQSKRRYLTICEVCFTM